MDGDRDAGQQFPTDIGPTDILARHRHESRWLVVELKRVQTGDETVGQVLRYMGWVTSNLAAANDTVEGLIVAHVAEVALQYAAMAAQNVQLMVYEVRFKLRDVPRPASKVRPAGS